MVVVVVVVKQKNSRQKRYPQIVYISWKGHPRKYGNEPQMEMCFSQAKSKQS